MVKIESAYLNADQEAKLNDLLRVAERYTGERYRQFSSRIPRGFGSMRVLFEALPCFNALAKFADSILESGGTLQREIVRALNGFIDVFNHEYEQVVNGTQKFVSEQMEKYQE